MSRAVIASAAAAAIAAAAAWLVVTGVQRPPIHSSAMVTPATAERVAGRSTIKIRTASLPIR